MEVLRQFLAQGPAPAQISKVHQVDRAARDIDDGDLCVVGIVYAAGLDLTVIFFRPDLYHPRKVWHF